jgi:lysozyme
MKTSPEGLEFIAHWEGEELHVYKDAAGVETIGIGHALRPGESFPNGITHEEALEILSHDVGSAENAVNGNVKVDLTQSQFDACVSFAFNCGGYAFAHSSVCSAINHQEWSSAADAFLLWDKRRDPTTGLLVVDKDLAARRQAESALFSRV